MSNNSKLNEKKRSSIDAGAAGVGCGTLLVLLAGNLPDTNQLKPWLLIIAPSVSVGLSALWLWAKSKIIQYMNNKEITAALAQAKSTLKEALENPSTSEAHKNELSKEMEKLEKIHVDKELKRVRALIK